MRKLLVRYLPLLSLACILAGVIITVDGIGRAGADDRALPRSTLSLVQSVEAPISLELTLYRIGSITGGWSYSLTIYGDGRVVYDGHEDVRVIGEVIYKIDREAIVRILEQFERKRFFDRDVRGTGCRARDSDAPSVIITLSVHGRAKTVGGEVGCELSELDELADTIDKETGSLRLVK